MSIVVINASHRAAVAAFLTEHWFSTIMVLHGESVDLSVMPGFIAIENGRITGLITYRMMCSECEILSLDSILEGKGMGKALLDEVVHAARENKCSRVFLITTNDNTHALRFYQRYGFDMSAFNKNAIVESRAIKPEIPLLGFDDIPVRHEIEMEMLL